MEEIWLTAEEYAKLEERLKYLRGEYQLKIAEDLKVARAFGDLSENAEYDAAKDAQAHAAQEADRIEAELRVAKIIDESNVKGNVVGIGSNVKVLMTSDAMGINMEKEFQILGTKEADPDNGRISNESPIGSALLGLRVGGTTNVTTPGGLMHLKVLSIGK